MKYNKFGDAFYIKGRIGWKGLKKKEYLQKSDFRIINGSNIVNGKIDWSTCGYISEERYYESPEIMLRENDILITKDGTIGKIAKVGKLTQPTTVASGIFLLRNENKLEWDTDYVFWFLNSLKFKEFINSRMEGSVIPHLYQKDFKDLNIAQIPIHKQKEISSKINCIQDKMDLNGRINDNLVKID